MRQHNQEWNKQSEEGLEPWILVCHSSMCSLLGELLLKYGAPKQSGIDPANYKALLKDVEGLEHA